MFIYKTLFEQGTYAFYRLQWNSIDLLMYKFNLLKDKTQLLITLESINGSGYVQIRL